MANETPGPLLLVRADSTVRMHAGTGYCNTHECSCVVCGCQGGSDDTGHDEKSETDEPYGHMFQPGHTNESEWCCNDSCPECNGGLGPARPDSFDALSEETRECKEEPGMCVYCSKELPHPESDDDWYLDADQYVGLSPPLSLPRREGQKQAQLTRMDQTVFMGQVQRVDLRAPL